jgi:hypothetical protein
MKILNELEYAKNLLEHGFSKYMSTRDLLILAKYYRYLGKGDQDVEHELIRFCQIHEPGFNEIIFADRILFVVNKSSKLSLRLPVSVPITENEINAIRSVGNYRFEKVLFTMLVLGKYYRLSNPNAKDTLAKAYYVNDNINTILKLAHTSQKKDENILHSLYNLGLIDYNKKLGTYVVKFANSSDTSGVVATVTDLKRLLEFYPLYCTACGKNMERTGRNQKLCGDCWKERQKILWKESKRKARQGND